VESCNSKQSLGENVHAIQICDLSQRSFRLRYGCSFGTICAQLETLMNSYLHRISVIIRRVRLHRRAAVRREAAS
jgi:hypothetical protein